MRIWHKQRRVLLCQAFSIAMAKSPTNLYHPWWWFHPRLWARHSCASDRGLTLQSYTPRECYLETIEKPLRTQLTATGWGYYKPLNLRIKSRWTGRLRHSEKFSLLQIAAGWGAVIGALECERYLFFGVFDCFLPSARIYQKLLRQMLHYTTWSHGPA